MTTRINTDGIADDAVTTAKIAAAAVGTSELADGGVTAAKIASGAVPVVIGVRQTVQGGPINASGLPDFLPASSVTLTLATQNISATYPLSVSASQGHGSGAERIGSVTGNTLSWTLSASSGVNYLYVDIAANGTLTTDQTTTAPVYSYTATSGTNTFNITTMTMFTSGSTRGWRVFVGEATAGASSISAVVAYAYNGVYSSYPTASAPIVTTATSITHNIGMVPMMCNILAECISADNDWSIGDVIVAPVIWNGGYMMGGVTVSKTAIKYRVHTNLYLTGPSSGSTLPLTKANWKTFVVANRGW